ncbi:MAG: hypothetical protein CBC29_09750 [Methylococcaceae bacterium TMED69]|nr:hypothetical protein [Pseudomonadota bacterium]OUU73978.1 MAG: hypothetical protein CBC29_09750 [Methylococcaceae bacterium TMED69]|tara:strand:+ start:556 stop:1452 length:897 start_codon:yes stop_codon:yes gene_type:complete
MTGSTGFIGKNIVEGLLNQGHLVVSIIREENKKKIFESDRNHSFIVSSISKFTSNLVEAFSEADIIIHCAGSVRGRGPGDFQTANIDAIQNFINLAKKFTTKPRFILISSMAARQPNLSDYSFSKWKGEQVLRNSLFKWVIVRPTAVYGPGDKALTPLLKMIARGICPNIFRSFQKLSILHVDDLALDIVEVVQNFEKYRFKTFEIHDGKANGYQWSEIIKVLRGKKRLIMIPIPIKVLKLIAIINCYLSVIVGYKPMLTLGKVKELHHPDWRCDNSLKYLETRLKNRITLNCNASEF